MLSDRPAIGPPLRPASNPTSPAAPRGDPRDALRQLHRHAVHESEGRVSLLPLPGEARPSPDPMTPALGTLVIGASLNPPSTVSSLPPPDEDEGFDAWTRISVAEEPVTSPLAVDVRRSSLAPKDPYDQVAALVALDDFTGALARVELLRARGATDPRLEEIATTCRTRLTAMYSSRLGSFDRRPMVVATNTDMHWLGVEPRAAFILSRIDGQSTVQDVLDVCGMPTLEALKHLVALIEAGAVRFES